MQRLKKLTSFVRTFTVEREARGDEESRQIPKKVPFRVIYCTGWEDDYPPKDLEVREKNRVPVALQMASGAVLQC